MGGKSERFIVRLDDEMLTAWKARAAVASTSVAALIIQSMEGQAPGPSADDLSAATQQTLAVKDAEITALAARVVILEADKSSLSDLLENAIAVGERGHARIAELEKALAASEVRISPSRALAVFRGDPANRIINPKVRHVSGPVLASAVPEVEGQATGFRPKSSWRGPKA